MGPWSFDIVNDDGSQAHVHVVNVFKHHYSDEFMRCIRIDSLIDFTVKGKSKFMVVNEEEFEKLLSRRKR